MKKNSLKKLVGVITLGLAITVGIAVGGQVLERVRVGTVSAAETVEYLDDYYAFEEFGHLPYGVYPDGSTYYESEDEIRELVKDGLLSEREGELEIQFLKATTDDEKNEIYKQLIDEVRDVYGLSDSEVERLKNAGYKDYNRVLDEIFYGEFENFEDKFGYLAYGVYPDGSTYYESEDEIRELVKDGLLSEREGELEIQFLKATTDDEKNEIYKQLIDETKESYGFNDSEIERLKNAGYKNYNRALDEIFYDQLVDEGFMTRREADLEIQYNAATNKEEREAVYDLMVDNMIDLGEVTRDQGDKLKADGYGSYHANISNFDFESTVDELLKEGAITKEQASDLNGRGADAWYELDDFYQKYSMTKELVDAGIITAEKATEFRNSDSDESWKELDDVYEKHYVDVAVREGDMTQEEADLWMAYVNAESYEDMDKAYNDMIDYGVKNGIITQEEADLERKLGFGIY